MRVLHCLTLTLPRHILREHDAQARLSVPNSHSQLQGEYPPCLSSDVLCGDLSPRVSHSCDPLFSESWGKILGLVAAPLVGNAVSSPVAESADPSGKDSLVRMGPACHSIASQSSSQPDSQSEAHTAPSSAVGLCEPLDRQKSKRIWRSKFGSDPSCVAARAPSHTTHPRQLRWGCIDRRIITGTSHYPRGLPQCEPAAHPHSAFQFQLASSQCPFSTGEPPEAVTPERHSAFLRPELFDNLGEKSVKFVDGFGEKSTEYFEGERLPSLVNDDASPGKEGSALVRYEADSLFEDRGEGKGSATATVRPVRTVTERSVRSGLIGSTLSGSSGRHPSRPPLAPLTIDTANEVQRVKRVSPAHLDVQAALLREPVAGSVLRDTPNYHGTVPVAHRTAVGEWKPTARSICSMLHAADIRGRWEAVVHARLRKWKKRCKSRLRNELKQEKWYERRCQREQNEHMAEIGAVDANIEECREGLRRYKGEMIYKLRQKLTLRQPKPNVCGVETQRELITPGRTQYSTRLATDNSSPVMLLYLVLLLIAGSLFIAVNASPELNHLVNTGIGSRTIVVLSAITIMQGCKLHNGSMIAAALMVSWYCLANTGNAAAIGGGPTYWIDLLIPFELRMACLLMIMCLATLIKADKPTRRAAASVISTVKDIRETRSLNNSIAAVNENTRKLFNSAYIEIELVDSPGTIIRVLLDTGASASCFSARALKSVWHKLQRTFSPNPINLVSAGGSSLGQNLGSTELKFRIPGQERVYCHRIEIIDNDGVPSILGVDFLKSVGATLQFTDHCDTATWTTPGHDPVTIPLHCTAPESHRVVRGHCS